MERRKFVIGLGALASGSAAAMGTGAFSAASMDRDANIDVVNDATGLIGLVPGDTDLVYETQNPGELKIDFTSDNGGEGVNVNSKYQVGAMFNVGNALEVPGNSPTSNPAFEVRNQSNSTQNLVIDYELTGDSGSWPSDNGSKLYFQARPIGGAEWGGYPIKDLTKTAEVGSNGGAVIAYTENNVNDDRIPAGNAVGVSILVDTTGENASPSDDLSGVLKIRAGSEALAAQP
jgi:hypothetical protein